MCEIALKFGKFTEQEINQIKERHSDGDGFFVIFRSERRGLIKSENGAQAIKRYLALNDKGIMFTLYHSRKASAGAICYENTQPFFDRSKNFVLAHNGTISRQNLVFLAFAMNKMLYLKEYYSDSRILYQIIKDKKFSFSDEKIALEEIKKREKIWN